MPICSMRGTMRHMGGARAYHTPGINRDVRAR
jgi:hypothetical protein